VTAPRGPLVVLLAILTLGLAGGLGCSLGGDEFSRDVERAEAAEKSGELGEAAILLRSALKLRPTDADVNFRLGMLSARMGLDEDAVFFLGEAVRLDPRNLEAHYRLAEQLIFRDEDQARELLAKAREIDPASPYPYIVTSSLDLVKGELDTALLAVLTALELAPESGDAHFQHALILRAMLRKARATGEPISEQERTEMVAAFGRAVELLRQDDPNALLVRAVAEHARSLMRWPGHEKQGLQAYRDAYASLRSDPDRARTLLWAAENEGRRSPELLVWALERRIELEPDDAGAWQRLAIATQRSGGDGAAVLRQLLEKRPTDGRAHAAYATFLAQTGRPRKAVEHLEAKLDEVEPRAPLLSLLVELQTALGQSEKADRYLDRLRIEAPQSVEVARAEAQRARARRDYPSAIRALRSWIDSAPSPEAYRLLADTYLYAGDPGQALAAADRGLELARQRGVRDPVLERLKARSALRHDDFETAARAFATVRKRYGNLPREDLAPFARALYEIGRRGAADQVLEEALGSDPIPINAALLFTARHGGDQPERSKTLLERAIAQHPHSFVLARQLVLLMRDREPRDAWIERLRALAAAHPKVPESHQLLAQALAAAGATDEALAVLRAALERWPGHAAVAQTAIRVFGQAGAGDELVELLEKQHAAGVLSGPGRLALARLYLEGGRRTDAFAVLEEALAATPDDAVAANEMAYLLAEDGRDLDRAHDLAQQARSQLPNSAQVADTLGFVYLKRKLYQAALVQFDEATSLAKERGPAWATAQFHRALALQALERPDEAAAAARAALGTDVPFDDRPRAKALLETLSS